MGKLETQKANAVAAIELVIKEFLQKDAIGKWFSVKERSIGNVMKQVGVSPHFSVYIYNELQNIGMIEKEGERVAMRYKILTNIIPDAAATANKIYENYIDDLHRKAGEKKSTDNQPQRQKKSYNVDTFAHRYDRNGRKRARKSEKDLTRIPHLGQVVYALVDGYITEAKITCVRFDEDNKVKIDFTTPITNNKAVGEEYISKKDYCLRNISFDVDELIKKLLNNVQKFNKVNK